MPASPLRECALDYVAHRRAACARKIPEQACLPHCGWKSRCAAVIVTGAKIVNRPNAVDVAIVATENNSVYAFDTNDTSPDLVICGQIYDCRVHSGSIPMRGHHFRCTARID